MKRLITLLAVAAAVTVVYAAPSSAVAPDTTGPPCADITFGDGSYDYYDTSTAPPTPLQQPSLGWRFDLAAPSCAAVTYTLFIYDSTGSLVEEVTVSGVSGQSSISFNYTFATTADADPNSLCLVGTTSLGKHVADRAPDSGCLPVLPNDPPASGFG